MTNIDDIRTDIMARIEAAESDLARIEIHKANAAATLQMRRAEFAGFERAVEAMRDAQAEPPTAPAKRRRRDVRGAVRATFGARAAGTWLEESQLADGVSVAGVSPEALHSYLLRAVKTGEAERDGKSNRYRLPLRPTIEFASAPPEQNAAE